MVVVVVCCLLCWVVVVAACFSHLTSRASRQMMLFVCSDGCGLHSWCGVGVAVRRS